MEVLAYTSSLVRTPYDLNPSLDYSNIIIFRLNEELLYVLQLYVYGLNTII